ncbi:MAG: YicC family protein [Firmicutes bacterium]|nr:YicC family protein [Bacillota bacterium]
MIRSMTGFGRSENSDDLRHFTVEIKSVNHRYNDVIIRMPKHLNYVEEKIKKVIKRKIKRGRVEVYIKLENYESNDVDVNPDISLAKSYKEAIDTVCDEINISNEINGDTLSRFQDIFKIEKKEADEDEVWNCLEVAVKKALENVMNMRIKEGKELAEDIEKRAEKIESMTKEIEGKSSEVVLEYKEKLKTRIEELLDENYEIDDNKLANEVAHFADKSNITEEVVRLYSHISQLTKTIKSDDIVGRKLDFLVQEMNRETNTIGSKSGDLKITNKVVDIKSELEKIREQVQNIE